MNDFALIRSVIGSIRNDLSRDLSSWDHLGVFRKLLLNETAPTSDLSQIRLLGFVHLTSASGIHLWALFHWVMVIVRLAMNHAGVSSRFAQKLALAASCVCAVWVVVLSQGRAGLLRPFLIMSIRYGLKLFGSSTSFFLAPLLGSLTLDFLVACLIQDWAPGRWHYGLAVGGGLLGWQYGEQNEWIQKRHPAVQILIRHFLMSFFSWVAVLPLDIYENHLVSLATPILSLLTVPLFGNIFYPLLVLFSLSGHLPDFSWVEKILEWLCAKAMLNGSLWVVRPEWGILAIVIGWVFSFIKLKFIAWVGLLGAIGLLRLTLGLEQPLAPQITQFSIGQGDAALYQSRGVTRSKSILIDTGPPRAFNGGRWMVELARLGVTSVDEVWLTHLDLDHRGGLPFLSKVIEIKKVIAPQNLEPSHLNPHTLFDTRAPPQGFLIKSGSPLKPNHLMMGVMLETEKSIYLNLGDSPRLLEIKSLPWLKQMMSSLHFFEKRRILKISHHGSKTSTSLELLKTFRPDVVWISCGLKNRYGHPHPMILSRLKDQGVEIKRTDRDGHLKSL